MAELRLVEHEAGWERAWWLLHAPAAGRPERTLLTWVIFGMGGLVGQLIVTSALRPDHIAAFGLVGLVLLGGLAVSRSGRHVVIRLSREAIAVDELQGQIPEGTSPDRIWTWPTSRSTRVPLDQIRAVARLPDGRVRISRGTANAPPTILGPFDGSTLHTLVPAVEQALRAWGGARSRASADLSEVNALRHRVATDDA